VGHNHQHVVIAFAGRRIDAPGGARRFPLECAGVVRERLLALFRSLGATALVSSAACGADLLAIDAARSLGIRFVIVLPFGQELFATSSVTDRPGDWLADYKLSCGEAAKRGDLIVMDGSPANDDAYARATARIVDEAVRRAADDAGAVAVFAHEGASRGAGDMTEAFAALARAAGLRLEHVSTLC
jgi:hypothetical protein